MAPIDGKAWRAGAVQAASSRGRYDRHASPSERARQQRASLIAAVRELSLDGNEVTVARVLGCTGFGRNTFYEHFDDVTAAVVAASAESELFLVNTIEAGFEVEVPRTPDATVRGAAEGWATWCGLDEGRHFWLLERHAAARMDEVLVVCAEFLHAELTNAGAKAGALDLALAYAVAGALRAVTRHLQHGLEPPEAATPTIAAMSHDVLWRLLR